MVSQGAAGDAFELEELNMVIINRVYLHLLRKEEEKTIFPKQTTKNNSLHSV